MDGEEGSLHAIDTIEMEEWILMVDDEDDEVAGVLSEVDGLLFGPDSDPPGAIEGNNWSHPSDSDDASNGKSTPSSLDPVRPSGFSGSSPTAVTTTLLASHAEPQVQPRPTMRVLLELQHFASTSKRRKYEILLLRDEASVLESQLSQLREKRAKTARAGKSHRSTANQSMAAAQEHEKFWKRFAQSQRERLQESQSENVVLRLSVREHKRMVHRYLVKQAAQVAERVPPASRLIDLGLSSEDHAIFAKLFAECDSMYRNIESVTRIWKSNAA